MSNDTNPQATDDTQSREIEVAEAAPELEVVEMDSAPLTDVNFGF
jgi:hypothetical protein